MHELCLLSFSPSSFFVDHFVLFLQKVTQFASLLKTLELLFQVHVFDLLAFCVDWFFARSDPLLVLLLQLILLQLDLPVILLPS